MRKRWWRCRTAALLLLGLGLVGGTARAEPATSEVHEFERAASPALGHELLYSLYLPPGYGDSAARYPTLYLLHGLDGNHLEWLKTGYLRECLDRLIAEGAVAPMIVVMPDGGDSWYVDSAALGGPGDYATAIGTDLVAAIDARYRTRPGWRQHGIGGLSMGGFGALRLAFAQPFRFAAAASFSGALWTRVTPESELGPLAERVFHGAFGKPFDARRFLAESPMTTMQSLIGAKDPPAVFLTVGDKDRYKLYEDTFELFMAMRRAGLPVEMRMTGGDHTWDTWAEELPEALRFFDRVFRRGE